MKVNVQFSWKSMFRDNCLAIATFTGVVLGLLLAVLLRSTSPDVWSPRNVMYLSFIGKLFLQMLKCIIIPLIIPSLITSIGSLNLSLSGKVGLRSVVYYLSTTLMAVILGIVLVSVIRPGVGSLSGADELSGPKRNVTTPDTLMDLIRNCFPPNIIQATFQQYRTVIQYPGEGNVTKTNGYHIYESDKSTWAFKGDWANSSNILGLVVFSILTGIAIAVCGDEGKPLLKFFESVSAVMMKITSWIICMAPVGVFFLVAGQMLSIDNFTQTMEKLGWYFATVVIGLLIHGFIVLPFIYGIICRKLPFKFILSVTKAITTAFGTASSSATLPITISCLEEGGTDSRIAGFVLPIGATINMDGTALYEAVAAIFIAQVRSISLSIDQLIAISLTATAAAIGAAGIPQAGLVTMVMVLDTVGIPSDDIALILAVDWLLDRCRTAINVLGDSIGAAIVAHLSVNDLAELDAKEIQSISGVIPLQHVNDSSPMGHTSKDASNTMI